MAGNRLGTVRKFIPGGSEMDWEKATRIAHAIGKSRLLVIRMVLFRKAADYARMRVDWQLLPRKSDCSWMPPGPTLMTHSSKHAI